jgi:hypothetical protein
MGSRTLDGDENEHVLERRSLVVEADNPINICCACVITKRDRRGEAGRLKAAGEATSEARWPRGGPLSEAS